MARAGNQYGLEVAEVLLPDDLEPPLSEPSYEPVDETYLDELQSEADKQRWAESVERNADSLPQEWVHPILERLQEEGHISVS